MTQISAKIVADSLMPKGQRLTTMLITFPRFILAELNTHRMLSKNSASSRAIPFKKMVESVKNDPFVPIAFQKDHKGMQGTEYFENEDHNEQVENWKYRAMRRVEEAEMSAATGLTKQLVNRSLEEFMWHTVLISGTEWENFFNLRCPQYYYGADYNGKRIYYRSKKQFTWAAETLDNDADVETLPSMDDDMGWLKINKGQAEIHMMALAEAMWDAMNESKPKQLQEGDWHIPFEDSINEDLINSQKIVTAIDKTVGEYLREMNKVYVKISTAMSARTSYTVVGEEKEISYETLIGIHDKMAIANPFHASPFEHCARVMSEEEFYNFNRGALFLGKDQLNTDIYGWCRNYRGFIQYRHLLETGQEL
jgi:hypothetical protein